MEIKIGVGNIVKFIVAVLLICLDICSTYLILTAGTEESTLSELVITSVFGLGVFCFLTWYAISKVVPKHLKEMRAVKKYLSLSQLRELVRDETFVPLRLPAKFKNKLSKGDFKEYEKELLVSKNWICANNILIPKKMIVSVTASHEENLDILYCKLVSQSTYEFACFRRNRQNSERDYIEYFSNNKEFSNISNIANIAEYTEEFAKKVHTSEEFLKFIQ